MTNFLERTLVLIPALNEALCVGETVESWLRLGARRVRVVDNGSRDETALVARRKKAEVVSEPQPGYGAAAWRGLQDWPADCDWVLFSSADGSDRLCGEDVELWERAVASGARLIIGDRTRSARSRASLKVVQRVGNWMTCEVIRLGWGARFNDMGSLRLARHADLVALQLEDRGFGWNVEMQVRAIERGWKIVELPVEYFPRLAGESKISGSLRGTIRAGWGILRMMRQLLLLHHCNRQRSGRRGTALPAAAPGR